MYLVINTNGLIIGYIENPRYITKSNNGSLIECGANEALGIAMKSNPYHLFGKEALEEAIDDVVLAQVDSGVIIFEDNTKMKITQDQTEDAVCELSETTEESIAALEQAICDLSEEIGG